MMKHFTILELGDDAESPMIGTIDNVVKSIIGLHMFIERFEQAIKEHFDSELLEYSELPDLFAGSPYEDINIKIDGEDYKIRIIETWIY